VKATTNWKQVIFGSLNYLSSILILLTVIFLSACKSDEPQSLITDTPGYVYTWAGTGTAGFDGDGHSLLESKFYWPLDVTIAATGDIYIVDWNNHRIRMVTADHTLKTVIGTDFVGDGDYGLTDLEAPGAPGTSVNLNHPTHFLSLPDGTFILTAWHNHKLRKYDPSTGFVYVMCGSDPGYAGDGGPVRNALLSQPNMTTVDSQGNLYVMDQRNERVRKIDANGMINTVVGNGIAGFAGDGGPPLDAELNLPAGPNPQPAGYLVFDSQGRLYISDALNNRIRRVDFGKNIIETIAGTGEKSFGGDDGPAIDASFNNPRDIAFGPDGRLYVADEFNNRIRAIDMTTGIITTVAGNGTQGFSGDGGPATAASFNRPAGIDFDAEGHLYIADTYNYRIRIVNPN